MKTVYLEIEDEFMESFLKMLPSEKVRVLEQPSADVYKNLHESLQEYLRGKAGFTPYHESMKELDRWLAEGGKA
jgi:hypothetical protein